MKIFTEEELKSEVWKPIKNYENYYEISNLGRVRSIPRNENIRFSSRKHTRILKLYKNINKRGKATGYRVVLCKNNKTKKFMVHRLVALAFIDNIHNYSFINHINGIKDDNRVENLEWCTSVENLNHALDNNLRIMPNGEKHHKSKLTEVQVLEIRNSHLSQKELTILYNVKQPLISAIINRKKWKQI